MNRTTGIAGWIVAAVFVAAAVALGVQSLNAKHEVTRLTDGLSAQKTAFDVERAEAGRVLEGSNKTVRDLTQRVTELEGKLAKNDTAGETEASSEASGGLIDRFLSRLKPSGSEKGPSSEGGDTNANPMAAMAKMFQGEAGQKMADYAAGMTMDMAYKDLFSQLNLPKDVEEQVREMLKSNMSEQITASMDMAQKGYNKDEADKLEKAGKARLKEQLAGVLSPQEVAQWEAYEDTIEDRMINQQVDMQLGMLASGLTPENRELVRGVLVEEMLAGKQGAGRIDDVQQAIDGQLGAIERARERLAEGGQLDEAQLAEFGKYVDMMKQQMEMARAMFSTPAQGQPAQAGQSQAPSPGQTP
jgi:hypothetical protein